MEWVGVGSGEWRVGSVAPAHQQRHHQHDILAVSFSTSHFAHVIPARPPESPANLCLSVCVAFLGLASDIPGRLSGSLGGKWNSMETCGGKCENSVMNSFRIEVT